MSVVVRSIEQRFEHAADGRSVGAWTTVAGAGAPIGLSSLRCGVETVAVPTPTVGAPGSCMPTM